MAGGRGLSVEEKRVKLLEIFHETKDFFTRKAALRLVRGKEKPEYDLVKELEKLGAKKGVVSQTVKEVLQTLVDDNLVELDKIGISNYYWSFPSARGAALVQKVGKAEKEISVLEARDAELRASITSSLLEREETIEREELLTSWKSLKESVAIAQTELSQYTNSGGGEAKARGVVLAKEAAVRWTDNLSIAIDYVSKTFSLPCDDVRQLGGIPEDFEDLDTT